MIVIEDLHKSFSGRPVLRGVSLTVAASTVHYVIGTSGAGKSVLVKHVAGFLRPDAGRVLVDDIDVPSLAEPELRTLRRRCVMVFQHSALFDSLSLVDNVALPLRKHRGLDVRAARGVAADLLAELGIGDGELLPAAVGEGVCKRVAVARALAMEPSHLVLDEPTTGLDPEAAADVDRLLRGLVTDLGMTCLVVSHDTRSVLAVADQVTMLYRGRVHFGGTPAALRTSDDPVVRQFMAGAAEGPLDEGDMVL